MFVVVGLGNPGREYADTRHNVGFMVIDALARQTRIKTWGFRFKGRTGSGNFGGQKLFLLKPRTYMNLSGDAVVSCLNGLKLRPSDLVVIHDDLDLEVGRVKVKARGGAGGHKGVSSIIERLGTDQFARIRIGVGKPGPDHDDTIDYVLSPFEPGERELIAGSIEKGVRATLTLVRVGVERTMNSFNAKE